MLLNLPSQLMKWVLEQKGNVSPSRFVQLLVEQEYNKCSNRGAENGMMGGSKKVWDNARNGWLGTEFSYIACVTPKSAIDLGSAVLRQRDLKTKGFIKALQEKWLQAGGHKV